MLTTVAVAVAARGLRRIGRTGDRQRLRHRAVDACANIDLSGADLSGADLSRATLSGTNLEGTDLSDANLTEADLSGAQIVDTDLSDADLTSANLTGATISGANLDGRDALRDDADAAARQAADAQRDVETERAGGDRLHVHGLVAGAEAHDRALAVHLLDLGERRLQRLHLVHRTPLNDLQFRPVRHLVHLYGKAAAFSIRLECTLFVLFGRVTVLKV